MVKKEKKIEQYNVNDIREIWNEEYYRKYKQPYYPHGSGIHENQLLKSLLDSFGVYVILLSIENATVKNCKDIRYFVTSFQNYSPKFIDYAKLEYYVRKFGGEEEKKKWTKLVLTFTRWIPDAEVKQRQNQLIKELEDWIKEIEE